MTSPFETVVAQYQQWRDQMINGIESYKTWLDANGHADIQQSLRIYDLIESLRNDRMTLAFLSEYSRGKTELVNAILFAGFKQRLLPSDVGRTTMCPTEIFHDPSEPPYLRLLPIETRARQESVSALKRQPVEWIKITLNTESREEMVEAMRHLVETKTIGIEEAKSLGLWSDANPMITTVVIKPGDRIDVPAWRHAMISYPHPLLKSGLVVLDTPGLNALGSEPELTLSMIPNAHAVLFLLAMDTGVTKSDLDMWQKHVRSAATRCIAVLNKTDLMWDDLKDEHEVAASISRQLDTTSALLELPRSHVMAVSAQKALLARIRGDSALLDRSGVLRLEHLLASEIIPARREILRAAVQREIGAMVDTSHSLIAGQLAGVLTELKQLAAISGKNRSMVEAMVARIEADRANYQATARLFDDNYNQVMEQGAKLLAQLADDALEKTLNKDRQFIEDAWTTAGLWKSMQSLFQHFTGVSKETLSFASKIIDMVNATYAEFHQKFGFAKLSPPVLNLEKRTLAMTELQETVRQFCQDPINVAKYKHFVINSFYDSLVAEARHIFEMTRADVDGWLRSALNPLNLQIKQHERVLAQRVENFKKIRDNLTSVNDRMKQLQKQYLVLQQQSRVLARIQGNLGAEPPVVARAA